MGKWTRRAFITTGVLAGGALALGVAIRPGNRVPKVKGMIAQEGETVLNVWLKIAPDNTITAIVPHAEMGQGVHTSLAMMLADEMDADWDKVRMQEAPAHKEYANYALIKGFVAGDFNLPGFLVDTADGTFLTIGKTMNLQITGGSSAVPFTGMAGMRVAGAAAKAVLLQAAADTWKVPVKELKAEKSHIYHQKSERSAPFAEFAAQAAELSIPVKPQLKSQEEFTIMGTSPQRLDIPVKVNGSAKFGIDAVLPGMKYATIKAAPVFGSKLKLVDKSAVENSKGIHKVIELDNAVAVIADGYWQAKQALGKLKIEFEKSENASLNQSTIYEQFANDLGKATSERNLKKDLKSGNTKTALSEAPQTIKAEYKVPYLAHATMEPMNCTVWVKENACEIWIGCQNPLGFASTAAKLLDIDIENVILHNEYLGGGFGRRSESDILNQAISIAKDVEYPVKLIWSREEDTQHDFYRDANLSRFEAGLNTEGNPIAWTNQYVGKHHPPDAPYPPYDIENQLIQYVESKTNVPWGNWRSVDHSLHAFFTESFIDELAHAANKDPFEYRRALLSQAPRFRAVLELAAEKAGWGSSLPKNWGRGIAVHKCFGTIVAQVAEVEVNGSDIRVHRVVCAADPGFAMHPDGFIAQMESGIIYGLTAALYGEISIKDGAVLQSNFHDYPMVRMNDAPLIETHIINSGEKPGGGGEPGTPPIAPAVANAIFQITGQRIRELPFKKSVS